MKRLLLLSTMAATLLVGGCVSTRPAANPTKSSPTKSSATTAGVSAPAPTTGGSASPSFKETARLDRELGDRVIPYPFNNCAVIQRPFGPEGPKHRRIYKGYEVLFCCTPCVRAFDANPEPYMPRIIAAANEKAAGTVTPPVVAGQ